MDKRKGDRRLRGSFSWLLLELEKKREKRDRKEESSKKKTKKGGLPLFWKQPETPFSFDSLVFFLYFPFESCNHDCSHPLLIKKREILGVDDSPPSRTYLAGGLSFLFYFFFCVEIGKGVTVWAS